MDVRPHPDIGLSTLTYLYDGEIVHRDSLGVEAAIRARRHRTCALGASLYTQLVNQPGADRRYLI